MISFARILAPSDFSSHSEDALRYACGLAERFQAELHVIHVLSEMVPAGPDPLLMPVMPAQYYEDDEKRATEALATVIKPEWGTPKSVTTAIRWGVAAEAIVDHAAEIKADLIVIATHGRTGLSHVLLGSVAERIVREAPCPVLTVRTAPSGAS
ncbi:universal stress protein [Planctomyces sp. SH-PL62]|uniref:universal stress protein n=1 Tax=Planctomyces sp. SH-PL62 TaxID=1636152 RepID=UPI00078CCDC2|nr:universal stress protein [Planctomyces sp. SH-PL62]AMV39559.1 Putative universal stress protein [Planctomyces sp. SH-PL62]